MAECIPTIPQQHRSDEAEIQLDIPNQPSRKACNVDLDIPLPFFASFLNPFLFGQINLVNPTLKTFDIGPIFPEWVPVEGVNPVILEGDVVADRDDAYPGPHVSFEDVPLSHYTHDFTFKVKPDSTPDNRYTNLLGLIPDESTGKYNSQEDIEIEWETGLGASNIDFPNSTLPNAPVFANPLALSNRSGNSGGFFSEGHKRRKIIWNWPTIGDHVHVEGLWVWDRGHPPAKTEIHPPRLVATRRKLPAMVYRPIDPTDNQSGRPVLATRIDVFASGDGSALWNNRQGVPRFKNAVNMNCRDYSFNIRNPIPRPIPRPRMRWIIQKHDGDTFPGDPIIQIVPPTPITPNPDPTLAITIDMPTARVTIPWRSQKVPDTAVFARTIYLFWDKGYGINPRVTPRVFNVTLESVHIVDKQDAGWQNDGEYRIFVEVGGDWLFVNELPKDDDILNDGLGNTGSNEDWGISRTFKVYVLPQGSFRIHAGGWEADETDKLFGKLKD